MTTLIKIAAATVLSGLFIVMPMQALAQIEDVEARREFFRLRKELDQISAELRNAVKDISDRAAKADKKAGLDIASEHDKLRAEIAGLRGQIEIIGNELEKTKNEVENTKRRQTDFFNDLGKRLSKLEPQRVTVDGKEVDVDQAEQKAFDQAIVHFKGANYGAAEQGFNNFLRRYPDSSYAALAYYGLGSTYFALEDCTRAIPAFQAVSNRYPMSEKAADAMLFTAGCQQDIRDERAARQTLETLLKKYPSSAAATKASQRLGELR